MRKQTRPLALLLAALAVLWSGAAGARAAEPEGTVLADNESAYAAVTAYDPAGQWGPAFTLHLENRTEGTLRFELTMASAGGRMCDAPWSTSVLAGQQADSLMIWDREALAEAGVNYIQRAEAVLRVYDAESREDVFYGPVGWDAPVPEGAEGPAVQERTFDGGLERTALLDGKLSAAAVDYDPAGGDEGGPALTVYLENQSDKDAYFTAVDAAVDGAACDPCWGRLVGAGKTAYDVIQWRPEDLEKSGVSAVTAISLRMEAADLEGRVPSSIGGLVTLTVGQPGTGTPEPTPAPDAEAAESLPEPDPAVYGETEGNEYRNEYFGLTCALPEDWVVYSDEELAQLEQAALEGLRGTEMEAYADAFTASGLNHYALAAYSRDGASSVNVEVTYLPEVPAGAAVDELLDAALAQLDLAAQGSSLGWEDAVIEKAACVFDDGVERPCLRVQYADVSLGIRVPVYMKVAYLLRDGYALQITASSLLTEEGIDGIMGCFRVEQAL